MADSLLDTSTRLAVQRTRLASERTLMAWIRTCTSLITFGFTIFKFFQYLATDKHRETVVSPWVVGMVLILIGPDRPDVGLDSASPGDEGTTGTSWGHALLDSRCHGRDDRLSRCPRTGRSGLEAISGLPGLRRCERRARRGHAETEQQSARYPPTRWSAVSLQ